MINVAIIDEQHLFSQLWAHYLQDHYHVRLTYCGDSAREFFACSRNHHPRMIFFSPKIPDMCITEFMRTSQRLYEDPSIIGIDHGLERQEKEQLLSLQAAGILNDRNGLTTTDLLLQTLLDSELILREQEVDLDPSRGTFTQREKQIIEFLVLGYTSRMIAQYLHITESTVATHRKRIRMKAQVSNTAELISYLQKHHILL